MSSCSRGRRRRPPPLMLRSRPVLRWEREGFRPVSELALGLFSRSVWGWMSRRRPSTTKVRGKSRSGPDHDDLVEEGSTLRCKPVSPPMQRRTVWTQCRNPQRSLGCQAGPSSFRRRSRGVQTSEIPRVSVGTQCEGQGRWEYDLRSRRVMVRPSAGSHLPSGLPWSEVSGWEQVVGSFVEGTESEVIESFAYVGRTWRSDSYGFNWIAGFRFRP